MSEDALAVINGVLQAGLLGGAIWLGWETRRLRVASTDAMTYEREAEKHRLAPQVRIGVRIDKAVMFQAMQVNNVSRNLAVNCVGFVYDRGNHNYLITRVLRNYIEPGHQVTSALSSDRFDIDGLTTSMQERLSALDAGELQKLVSEIVKKEPTRSVIGYIFHDVLRNPYIQFRLVDLEDERVRYRFSQFAGHPKPLRRQ